MNIKKYFFLTTLSITILFLSLVLAACGSGGGETAQVSSAAPLATVSAATSVTDNGATLNGSVVPNGFTTDVWFEYGTDASLATYANTAIQSLGNGSSPSEVEQTVSGCAAGTVYYFRVCGSNIQGTTKSTIASFTTSSPGAAPTVTTLAASAVTATGATLNGEVNSNGLATTVWFEWGTNSSLLTYSSTPTQFVDPGSTTTQSVTYGLSGLSAGTTYYYRIAANNYSGTTTGNIASFTYYAYVGTYIGTWHNIPLNQTGTLDVRIYGYSNNTLTGWVNDHEGEGNLSFASGYIYGNTFHAVVYGVYNSSTMDGTFSANGLTLSGTYQSSPASYGYGNFTVTKN
jgi:hypothetical protein